MKTEKIRSTKPKSLDQLEDKYFGKRGAPKREEYESQVRIAILGELLKKTREDKHLTQAQLAKILGMDTTYVSKIENNVKTQRLDTLLKVLKALHGDLFIRLKTATGTKEVRLI